MNLTIPSANNAFYSRLPLNNAISNRQSAGQSTQAEAVNMPNTAIAPSANSASGAQNEFSNQSNFNNQQPENKQSAMPENPVLLQPGMGSAAVPVLEFAEPAFAENSNDTQKKADEYTPSQEAEKQNSRDERIKALREEQQKESEGCQTCKNRSYQDGSNDPGVSFKTPTKIAPAAVAGAVRGHEMEHVSREQLKAERTQREIISQTVTLHNGICGECGKVYISGGTTRTASRGQSAKQQFGVGTADNNNNGKAFSAIA